MFLLTGVTLVLLGAPPDGPDPAELVRQLGAPVAAERDAAAEQLERMGEAVLPVLRVATDSRNPEVRAAMSEDGVFAFATGLIENCRTTATEERPADVGMRMDIALACIGDYRVRGQLRLDGDRLWRVTVGGPGDVADGEDATRFLSSFRLVAE